MESSGNVLSRQTLSRVLIIPNYSLSIQVLLCAVSQVITVKGTPVFVSEEVSEGFFTVLPFSYNFYLDLHNQPNVSLVSSEERDSIKVPNKALVSESNRTDVTTQKPEEPITKLLERTFTDLHPKIAIPLANKTLEIQEHDDVATTTTSTTESSEGRLIFWNVALKEVSTCCFAEVTEEVETTTEDVTTEQDTETPLYITKTTTTATTPATKKPTATKSNKTVLLEKEIKEEEKKLEEEVKEIEAEPVILTQGV